MPGSPIGQRHGVAVRCACVRCARSGAGLATATGTTIGYLNGATTIEVEIGAVVAVTFAVLGLLANKANTGSLLGRAKAK